MSLKLRFPGEILFLVSVAGPLIAKNYYKQIAAIFGIKLKERKVNTKILQVEASKQVDNSNTRKASISDAKLMPGVSISAIALNEIPTLRGTFASADVPNDCGPGYNKYSKAKI